MAKERQLTRRSFLATTALTAGALATAGAAGCTSVDTSGDAAQNVPAEEKTAINFCRGNCGQTCPQRATVREGKVVKIVPIEKPVEYRESQVGVGCVKGRAGVQRLYAPNRVLHPMLQKGGRGNDEGWEQITWDEAIQLVADKFTAAINEHGGASVAFCHHSGNNHGYLNGIGYAMSNIPEYVGGTGVGFSRFTQKIGATALVPPSDMGAVYMGFVLLSTPLNGIEDVANAKTIINWGADPGDAKLGNLAQVKARRNGATVVTIDPVFTRSAAMSDIWVPIRPATDGAMGLAMANYIIDNDLIDYDYLKNKSIAPLLVKEDGQYLRLSDLGMDPVTLQEGAEPVDTEVVYDEVSGTFGSSFQVADPAHEGAFDANGIKVQTVFTLVREQTKQFTVEYAAQECGVPAETIEQVATLYATNGPSTLVQGFGREHYTNGWHFYKVLPYLASLTGNMNKPGGSCFQYGASSDLAMAQERNNVDATLEDRQFVKAITSDYLIDIMETGKWAGADYPIRCVYNVCGNPITNNAGGWALVEAYNKVDFVVTADSFMTDTARYSDLVLPIALSWEAEDCTPKMFMNKAVEPAGECWTDMQVYRAVSEKMGFGDLFDKTDEEYLRTYVETEANAAAGITYDSLREEGIFTDFQLRANVGVEYNATGRTQFYVPYMFGRDSFGQTFSLTDQIPYYEHANEAYEQNPLKEKYPLYGLSKHTIFTSHGNFLNIPWLEELEVLPYVLIHEETAAARGIADGDVVRVFNDHGELVCPCRLTQGLRPDTLRLPHGWQESDYVKGSTKYLANCALDKVCSNTNFNDFLCEVEKYEGGAE